MPRNSREFPLKKIKFLKVLSILIGLAVLAVGVYFIPPVHDRLSWRLLNLRAKIFYFFNPPEEVSFSPEQQAEMAEIVKQSQTAMVPTATVTLSPSTTPTNYISPTHTQTATPTPSPTPIPDRVRLEGVVHEYQKFNNCGPAVISLSRQPTSSRYKKTAMLCLMKWLNLSTRRPGLAPSCAQVGILT